MEICAGAEACPSHIHSPLSHVPTQPISKASRPHLQSSLESHPLLPSLLPPPWSEPPASLAWISTLMSQLIAATPAHHPCCPSSREGKQAS